jgi:hypothetical protein
LQHRNAGKWWLSADEKSRRRLSAASDALV